MEIVMPKMGESVNEGTIIKWHKEVGDNIKRDEIIFEISTDKVDTEIPAPADGILKEIKVNEGDTVEVGVVVAVLDVTGEAVKTQESSEQLREKIKVSKSNQGKASGTAAELFDVEMPKMGESVMEGTILKWFKKVGDPIKRDETLFEISTDKVDTEVPSPIEGTIAEILVGEQETVDVGTIVAKISSGKEIVKTKISDSPEPENDLINTPVTMHDNFAFSETSLKDKSNGKDRFYSPLVQSIAQKEGIGFDELARINGTGLNERVTKTDILSYLKRRVEGKVKPLVSDQKVSKSFISGTDFPITGDIERIPMDNIRQKIMEHMVASRDTSVHVTSLVEVDVTRIDKFINENKDEYLNRAAVKLTFMAFIADACIKALRTYPLVNSSIDGNTIIQKKYINLGIAVAVEPTGLIVPNIKSADQRNITGLANAISDLAFRTRNKKLTPDDVVGGTFTITNFGVFGTTFGIPIINQPEVAILGVGAAIKRPVVINADGSDAIAIRTIMEFTLSHDHRLIDGMLGSLFLKHIKETLEGFEPGSVR